MSTSRSSLYKVKYTFFVELSTGSVSITLVNVVVDIGGIEVVGLGPDYMLNFEGRDEDYLRNTNQLDISWTKGLEDTSEIYNIVDALKKAGFSESDIDKITSGNMKRLIGDVLPI